MKRLLTILLTALLVFSLAPTAIIGEDEATITLSSVNNANPGDEITVDVTIAGNYKVHIVNFTFEYDPGALELVDARQGELLQNVASQGIIVILDEKSLASVGRIALGIAGALNPLEGEGELLKLKFKIKEGVTVNQQVKLYVSEFSYMPIGETTSTPVKFNSVNSIITLSNGTVPDGGYDEGHSGIEQGSLTPVPGFTPPPYDPETLPTIDPSFAANLPSGSVNPSSDPSALPTSTPDAGSENKLPGVNETGSGVDAAPTQKPASDRNNSSALIWILLGILAVAAAGAVAAITIRKNKNNK